MVSARATLPASSTAKRLLRRSWRTAGRLVPAQAHLHSRAVVLRRGACMDWHTTAAREELLLVLAGRLAVETRRGRQRLRRVALQDGQSLFLPPATAHHVLNAGARAARYIYVTG